MIRIDYEKCVGCGLCVKACFSDAIRIENKKAAIGDNCIYCGSCKSACPVDAIDLGLSDGKDMEDLNTYSGVWVVMENDEASQMPKKYPMNC